MKLSVKQSHKAGIELLSIKASYVRESRFGRALHRAARQAGRRRRGEKVPAGGWSGSDTELA